MVAGNNLVNVRIISMSFFLFLFFFFLYLLLILGFDVEIFSNIILFDFGWYVS